MFAVWWMWRASAILLWERFGTNSFTLANAQSTWCPDFQACTAMPFIWSCFFTVAFCSVSRFLRVLPEHRSVDSGALSLHLDIQEGNPVVGLLFHDGRGQILTTISTSSPTTTPGSREGSPNASNKYFELKTRGAAAPTRNTCSLRSLLCHSQ